MPITRWDFKAFRTTPTHWLVLCVRDVDNASLLFSCDRFGFVVEVSELMTLKGLCNFIGTEWTSVPPQFRAYIRGAVAEKDAQDFEGATTCLC